MRRVSLAKTEFRPYGLPADAGPLTFDPAETILAIANGLAIERGLTLADIARYLRVVTAVQQAKDAASAFVDLEDADWQVLVQMVEGFPGYRILHPVLLEFAATVRSAWEVKANG